MTLSQRLEELGIELPAVVPPVASYVPALRVGQTVRTSGQLPLRDGVLVASGRVGQYKEGKEGEEALTSPDDAYEAAKQCALNALAAAADAAGGIDRIGAVIKLTGFVSSASDFYGQPAVVNGASDLYHLIFGGLHIRSAVGVAALPQDASVEIEVEFSLL